MDRSFVARIGSADQTPLVRTVVQLGESLGLQTVVEGIETTEQLEALRNLGVSTGQGFYLAMPMEADDLDEFLSDSHAAAELVPETGSNVIRLRRA